MRVHATEKDMADQSENKIERSPPSAVRGASMGAAALVIALMSLLLAGWQLLDSRRTIGMIEHEVAKRLGEVETQERNARALAAQSSATISDINARLGQLESRIYETQNQRLALESLYRELSRNRDEWTLAEIEQALLIANQQLQLAGNVKAALIALETADARLARMDRPQLAALRRAINRDMERLKAAPYRDVLGMAMRLDNVATRIETLSLAVDQRAELAATGVQEGGSGFWQRVWLEVRQDVAELIRIQNVKSPGVPLLTPDQAFFLRENLRLRLLGARLSLLAHDDLSFRADVAAAAEWLSLYFDGSNKGVVAAQATLKQLLQSVSDVRPPDISASLDAARNFLLVRERMLR